MRQIVTGRFRTWEAARHAQDALMLKGFAASDIELPVQGHGVRAGIERLVASFFATDPRAGGTRDAGPAPMARGDTVLLGVHVSEDAQADLAGNTMREAHALEIATRGAAWTWPMHHEDGTREHSALDELGLAGLAGAVRRGAVAAEAAATRRDVAAQPAAPASTPGKEADATALAAASVPGAGAVLGSHVEVPGAPEAMRPAQDAAPQIPDEFLEYEDDTPAHHRTLH